MIFKKADRLILKGFIGPYVVAFFIVEFVLVMMFMWMWIDDLLGRGFSMFDYLELIGLYGVTIIPLALPLTVLLSSVMVYGDMAEHYELSSLKSAGLSLVRIFRPALIVAIGTALLSITASNYFKPHASEAFFRKFNDMKRSKITFAFEEKIFNNDFQNHSIYIDKKDKDGKRLEKILIYYINDRQKNLMDVLIAEYAIMQVSPDGKNLVMDLYNGHHYAEDVRAGSRSNYLVKPDRQLPINKASFKKYRKVFELKDIFRDMSNLNLERKKHDMLNTVQILQHIDSLDRTKEKIAIENYYSFGSILTGPSDTSKAHIDSEDNEIATLKKLKKTDYLNKKGSSRMNVGIVESITMSQVLSSIEGNTSSDYDMIDCVPDGSKIKIIDFARSKLGTLKTQTFNKMNLERSMERIKERFRLRLHQQYCFSAICILLLFIGGPMGAIVKKGGFGYPMLVAIGFYSLFIILNILGERLVGSGSIGGTLGAWLSFIILFPFFLEKF